MQGNQTLIFTLVMRSQTQGAEIRYSINNFDNDVSPTSTLYNPTSPPQLGASPGGTTYYIKARAYKNGVASTQSVRNYTVYWPFDANGNRLDVANVTLDPPGGLYHNPVSVVFRTGTSSAQFSYTIDGSDPPNSVTAQTRNNIKPTNQPSETQPLSIIGSTVLKVAGTRLSYFPSGVAAHEYVLRCGTPEIAMQGAGTASPALAISTVTTGATIRYTLDGSEPTAASPAYSAPVAFTPGTQYRVQARAFRGNFVPSEIAEAVLDVRPPLAAPVFVLNPQHATVIPGVEVGFTATASGEPPPQIFWEKDGLPLGETGPELRLRKPSVHTAGGYRAIAVNSEGTSTSASAILTVDASIEAWRMHYFGTISNTGVAADNFDFDGDQISNIDEWRAGTDPTSAASALRMTGFTFDTPAQMLHLSWPTAPGKVYIIKWSPDLFAWHAINSETYPGAGADRSVQLPTPPHLSSEPRLFFRVEVSPDSP